MSGDGHGKQRAAGEAKLFFVGVLLESLPAYRGTQAKPKEDEEGDYLEDKSNHWGFPSVLGVDAGASTLMRSADEGKEFPISPKYFFLR